MESSPYLPESKKSRGETLAELIVKVSAGAAGIGATAASGEPLAGVGTGVAADQAGRGLLTFFHRGEDRAQKTIHYAAQRCAERQEAGEQRREDGFRGAAASESVEAAIKAAANSVEQRKGRLIGALLASAEFETELVVADLLRYLHLLEDLSWRQILALAYFAEEDDQPNRVLIAAGGANGTRQIRLGFEAELAQLAEGFDLIGLADKSGGVSKPTAVYGGAPITAASLDKVEPTGLGLTLHRLAEMKREVSSDDLEAFVRGEILDA